MELCAVPSEEAKQSPGANAVTIQWDWQPSSHHYLGRCGLSSEGTAPRPPADDTSKHRRHRRTAGGQGSRPASDRRDLPACDTGRAATLTGGTRRMKVKHGHNRLWRDTVRFSQDDTVPDRDMLWPPGRTRELVPVATS